jgi:hypothetical protein
LHCIQKHVVIIVGAFGTPNIFVVIVIPVPVPCVGLHTTINQLSLHEEFMMPSPSRNNSARTMWCLMPMPYVYAATVAVAIAAAVYGIQCHLIGD